MYVKLPYSTAQTETSGFSTQDDVASVLNSGAHSFHILGSQKLPFINFPVSRARPEKIV